MHDMKSPPVDGSATLVLLLHAYTQSPRHLAAVRAAIADEWPEARLVCPELPLSLLSMADPNEIVAGLLDTIDAETAAAERAHAPITNIVLVGHSFGALLARKLYVVACGETAEAPFEPALTSRGPKTPSGRLAARPWAVHVSRLVLLAGMNRGWRITHHLGIAKAPVWTLGAAFGHLVRLVSGRTLAISTIRRGRQHRPRLGRGLHLPRRALLRACRRDRAGRSDAWPGAKGGLRARAGRIDRGVAEGFRRPFRRGVLDPGRTHPESGGRLE